MIRRLLLLYFFLAASVTLSSAQTDPTLGQAGSFTVLATTEIINTGQTGVTGNVGVSPGTVIVGEELLQIEKGRVEKGTAIAASAREDASAAYNSLSASTPVLPLLPIIGTQTELAPGTYKSSGNLSLQGVLTLNGLGNLNSVFIIIVDGNITSSAPNAAIRLVNGAQAKNVYWVVSGGVELGSVSSIQGSILAQKDITLHNGTIVSGRVVSLTGKIVLNSNNLYTPTIVEPNLSITKSAPVKAYLVGDRVTYTITVHNAGPGAATEVVVKDNFPASLRYVPGSAVYTGGVYNENTHIWSLGLVQVTESQVIELTFEILSGGTIVNTATVDSKETDPKVDDNTDEETIVVPELSANLNVTKVATGAPYIVGGNVTYTITVSNTGDYAAAGVTLTEQLPEGLEFVSATVSQGVYNKTTGIYVIGALQPGGQATLTLVAKITKQGEISNSVVVTSDNTVPDKDPTDDTDEEIIEVLCDPVVGFGITGNTQVCEDAASTTFTVTPILNGTYTFTLSGGLTQVSQSSNTITVSAGTTSGAIKVEATNLCGDTFTATKEITVVNKLTNPTITGPATVCANSTENTYSVAALAGDVTYTWATTGDLRITEGNNTPSVQVSAGALGGNLTLVASNSCFRTQIASTEIKTTPVPAIPASIFGSQAVCIGNEVTYSITAVTGASGYTWDFPANWSVVRGEGTAEITVNIAAGAVSGDVTVTANNECGSSAAKVKAVTVNDKLTAPAIFGNTRGCIGEQITYTIPAVNGATGYEWTVPETWTLISGANTRSIVVEVGSGNGQIQVGVNSACGQGEKATIDVAPTPAPTQNNQIIGEMAACLGGQSLTFALATIQDGVTYNWTLPDGLTLVSGAGSGTITVKATKAVQGPISVVATNNCGTAPRISLNVTITAPPAAPGMVRDNSDVCNGLSYSIEAVPGATNYLWTVPAGFTITAGQGTTTIKVKADRVDATGQVSVVAQNGACNSPATSTAIDATLADGELGFPKAFSPNGDGINDEWVVKNLPKYPNSEVTIFNRWGSEVYRTKNYQNNWRGNNLEQGTYFYKVRVTVCDGVVKEFTGYVTLFR